MLAQEGLELVRNMRDKNWITAVGGDQCLWSGEQEEAPCIDIIQDAHYAVDYLGNIDQDPAFNDYYDDKARLYLNNGFYDHDNSGKATSFYRLIEVTKDGDNKLLVDATISWKIKGREYYYTASTYVNNWR